MVDLPSSGRVFGVPYNFEPSSPGRLLAEHWRPDEGMVIEKPFGIGWTLNLANPRSWLLLAVAFGVSLALARLPTEYDEFPSDDPVEIEI